MGSGFRVLDYRVENFGSDVTTIMQLAWVPVCYPKRFRV
jgi:hypothetical protein